MKRDFLCLSDFSENELLKTLDLSFFIKDNIKNETYKPLKNKILGMIFEKHSTRTRLSFEAGMKRLGGDAIFLSSNDIQLNRGETIGDTAKVVSKYLDAVMIRTFEHARLVEFAKNAQIPVINGLSNLLHPCQVLSDIMTIKEHFGSIDSVKIAYLGDGNNMANSWILAGGILNLNVSIACPQDLSPNGSIINQALSIRNNNNIQITNNPKKAIENADVVYTDTWISMGEKEKEIKKLLLEPFQVNQELVKYANERFVFMHCLPAHRGNEVTDEIIDSKHSIVFTQAENRLYVQMAILVKLFERS